MGKRTRTLWQYFDYVDLREFDGEVYANCKYCPRGFDLKRTNCMWSHLKRSHKHVYSLALENQPENIRQRKGQDTKGKGKISQSKSVKAPSRYQKSKKKPTETPKIFFTINDDSEDEEEMAAAPPRTKNHQQQSPFTNKVIRGNSNNVSVLKCKRGAYSQQENIFLLAVAAELQNMTEECKDMVKAAIWQVLCKVKQLQRRNLQLSMRNIFA